jgi:hypothetical protein
LSTLSDHELTQLAELGRRIKLSLECDTSGTGVPCRTDRLEAVKDMKKYLEIHDYMVV